MIIDGFFGDRLYSVTLDEDEYALFSDLMEQREFFDPDELLKRIKEQQETQPRPTTRLSGKQLLERRKERLRKARELELKKARAKAVPSPQSPVLHEGSHMSATPKTKTALGEFIKKQPSSIERLKNAQRPGALQHSIERAKIAAARPIPKKAISRNMLEQNLAKTKEKSLELLKTHKPEAIQNTIGKANKAALKKSILPAGKSWASLIKRLK